MICILFWQRFQNSINVYGIKNKDGKKTMESLTFTTPMHLFQLIKIDISAPSFRIITVTWLLYSLVINQGNIHEASRRHTSTLSRTHNKHKPQRLFLSIYKSRNVDLKTAETWIFISWNKCISWVETSLLLLIYTKLILKIHSISYEDIENCG